TYLSAGSDAATELVLRLTAPLLADPERYGAAMDPKTSLQELAARLGATPPLYTVEADGPDHHRLFTATVTVGDLACTGEGTSKKTAEMAWALAAWRELSERADSTGAWASRSRGRARRPRAGGHRRAHCCRRCAG